METRGFLSAIEVWTSSSAPVQKGEEMNHPKLAEGILKGSLYENYEETKEVKKLIAEALAQAYQQGVSDGIKTAKDAQDIAMRSERREG